MNGTVLLERAVSVRQPVGATLQPGVTWTYNRWLGRWRPDGARAMSPVAEFESAAASAETVDPVLFDDNDRTLVERVKKGDVRAFETLHKRYHARIYRFAFLRLGNAEDAADVAADTFCRALRSLQSYQFRRTNSIYPWLHQIASNRVVDLLRDRPAGGMVLSLDAQAADDVDSFLEYLPADGPTPQELVERTEVQELVRAAITELPADQARALSLRFLGDFSIREISLELDRSEGAVKSLLHRALQNMRHHLRESLTTLREEGSVTLPPRLGKAEEDVTEVIHLHQGRA